MNFENALALCCYKLLSKVIYPRYALKLPLFCIHLLNLELDEYRKRVIKK
ncbi:MAG: hypothetical protein QXX95_02010 [Nitrososphaerales archaeon]